VAATGDLDWVPFACLTITIELADALDTHSYAGDIHLDSCPGRGCPWWACPQDGQFSFSCLGL